MVILRLTIILCLVCSVAHADERAKARRCTDKGKVYVTVDMLGKNHPDLMRGRIDRDKCLEVKK